ncbi:hypothetical protein [Urbifossiella limnaea]|uniref:Uncharacterized protein n=1 Tax=Urbifossiella limnaea TaxID=2528023 RepID=A0A517XW63_9BACT|nr:hypothetical protein [Urbifossiella limnaea]QDU21727.1 hypothetical protein ETAA1_37000 [Urbifossiella limnaea]
MIVIPRGVCRAFPALARKCLSGRPRGPAPMVVCEVTAGTLAVWARTADAVLAYSAPCGGATGEERVVVPMTVLAAVGGPGTEPVELAVGPGLVGEARFSDRGVPTAHPFEAILPGRQHQLPEPPDAWHPVGPDFPAALHECGRTAAKDATRFALTRLQLRGKAGQVVATDGRTALVWGGFSFPFAADLLVPAVPVFGARELASGVEVRVGRTATHLVVESGPWRVFLAVDTAGRYPDVAGIVPRDAPTVAGIDEADAAALADRLPDLPGADAECRPVTLALDRGVVVLARDDKTGAVERVRLEGSPSAGPRARVVIDRRVLARALALGCHTVRVAGDKPVVFEGGGRTFITVALDPSLAVAADTAADLATVTDVTNTTITDRRIALRHETNGHAPNGRHDPPAADAPDPLAAAEELRLALGDALAKAGRLVAALKCRKKEQRALTQVWSSLKALNLAPGGQP